jgi:hypothetical protein
MGLTIDVRMSLLENNMERIQFTLFQKYWLGTTRRIGPHVRG